MFIHWHTEAPGEHLVRHFVDACLSVLHRPTMPGPPAVHSWPMPEGRVAWRQFPDGVSGEARSWRTLTRSIRPDMRLIVRPEIDLGATLSCSTDDEPGEERHAWWTWTETAAAQVDGRWRTLPNAVLAPRLACSPRRMEGAGPPTLGLVADWQPLADCGEWLEFVRRLRAVLPGLQVKLLHDMQALDCRVSAALGSRCGPAPLQADLAGCHAVALISGEMRLAPVALEALETRRLVIAPREAEFAEYLADGRGVLWNGETGAVDATAEVVRAFSQDDVTRDTRARQARAWSHRRSIEREAARFRALVDQIVSGREQPGSPTPSRPTRWLLRREVGIGDVIFALTVAGELKRLDPTCEVTLHTSSRHATWARWFPFVDRVTSGKFKPEPGQRRGEFETFFPADAPLDRTLALGALIGVQPRAWVPPPVIPRTRLREAEASLGPREGLRIAFAPTSKGQSETRSLPMGIAREVAAQLGDFGQVIWFDEARDPREIPEGVLDLRGRLTLPQAFAAVALCDLVVSVDSGILHMGVTLRKPVVGLFSHIHALQRLWLAERFVALQPQLPCAPCGEGPDAWHCRRGKRRGEGLPLACVALLRTGEILAAAEEALRSRGRVVWNLGPDGTRTVWDVDTLPAPWAAAARSGGGTFHETPVNGSAALDSADLPLRAAREARIGGDR